IALVSGSGAPGAMVSLTLSQVRLSSLGSFAKCFQKLFTSGTLRVFLMSSNTARTSRGALRASTGFVIWLSRYEVDALERLRFRGVTRPVARIGATGMVLAFTDGASGNVKICHGLGCPADDRCAGSAGR